MKKLSVIALLLSIGALLLSIVALMKPSGNIPAGKPNASLYQDFLSAYDFSSPEKALESVYAMKAKSDFLPTLS